MFGWRMLKLRETTSILFTTRFPEGVQVSRNGNQVCEYEMSPNKKLVKIQIRSVNRREYVILAEKNHLRTNDGNVFLVATFCRSVGLVILLAVSFSTS